MLTPKLRRLVARVHDHAEWNRPGPFEDLEEFELEERLEAELDEEREGLFESPLPCEEREGWPGEDG